jgi:hypothetical protein
MRQLVASLLEAIMPEPSFDLLRIAKAAIHRHLCEPPRKKRTYQRMFQLC